MQHGGSACTFPQGSSAAPPSHLPGAAPLPGRLPRAGATSVRPAPGRVSAAPETVLHSFHKISILPPTHPPRPPSGLNHKCCGFQRRQHLREVISLLITQAAGLWGPNTLRLQAGAPESGGGGRAGESTGPPGRQRLLGCRVRPGPPSAHLGFLPRCFPSRQPGSLRVLCKSASFEAPTWRRRWQVGGLSPGRAGTERMPPKTPALPSRAPPTPCQGRGFSVSDSVHLPSSQTPCPPPPGTQKPPPFGFVPGK